MRIPKFEYRLAGNKLQYRWANSVANFDMPVKVSLNGKEQWLEPTTDWKELKGVKKGAKVEVDKNFYVTSSKATTT
ncbi:hypothetical protein GCM10028895_15900 [Pontibacter rugosus]